MTALAFLFGVIVGLVGFAMSVPLVVLEFKPNAIKEKTDNEDVG